VADVAAISASNDKPKLHLPIALVVTIIIILVLVLGLLQYVLNLFPPPEPLEMFSEWSS
jgi:hypothetical protein